MKKFLLPVLICTGLSSYAQISNFKIHAGTNYSLIKENRLKTEPVVMIPTASGSTSYYSDLGTVVEKFDSKPGFSLGTTFQVFEDKGMFVETGASFQYYHYKRSVYLESNTKNTDPLILGNRIVSTVGSPFPYLQGTHYNTSNDGQIIVGSDGFPVQEIELMKTPSDLGKTSTLYVQIPVLIGQKFLKEKLIIKTGVSANVLLYAAEYKYASDIYGETDLKKDTGKKDFNPVLVNGTLQATYMIKKQLGIDVSYQYSFSSVYKNNEIGRTNFNVLTLGASYRFATNLLKP